MPAPSLTCRVQMISTTYPQPKHRDQIIDRAIRIMATEPNPGTIARYLFTTDALLIKRLEMHGGLAIIAAYQIIAAYRQVSQAQKQLSASIGRPADKPF